MQQHRQIYSKAEPSYEAYVSWLGQEGLRNQDCAEFLSQRLMYRLDEEPLTIRIIMIGSAISYALSEYIFTNMGQFLSDKFDDTEEVRMCELYIAQKTSVVM